MCSKFRNNIATVIFILFSLQCVATVPQWNWAHNPGGHGDDWFGAMTCDASGNTYITGGFTSNPCYFGSFNLSNSGYADICVAKYDIAGNVIWAKSAGSSDYEDGHAIAVDASGNVYVGGCFRSDTIIFASDTLINPSYNDEEIFILKYDANGNELWAKRFGNTYHDELNAMTIDASGNLIIAGQFMASSITLGAFTLQNPYLYYFAMLVAKLDANGNVIWAMTPNGINVATPNSLSMDPFGNIFVSGIFGTSDLILGPDTLSTAGNGDIFLSKFDDNGNVLWARRAGGNQWDLAYGLSSDASGNAYVAGNFSSPEMIFGNDTLRNTISGNYNSYLAKYDGSGNILWARSSVGSNTQNGANTVATDAALNVYLAGNFYTPSLIFGSDTLLNDNTNHFNDGYLVKYDASGNELWAKRVGGNDNDEIYSLVTDPPGNVYAAGDMGSHTMVFDSFILNNISPVTDSLDIFIARISDFTVGEQALHANDEISVYPNPSQGIVQLILPADMKECQLSVYNVLGEIVLERKIKNATGNYPLDLTDSEDGLYFIKLKWEDKNLTGKIVIQH